MGEGHAEPALIEVGASRADGDIRYWRAKEAVAKGELILTSQISALTRMMTSASSILGWSVTISIALVAAMASRFGAGNTSSNVAPLLLDLFWPALATEVLLLTTAICCVSVLWPSKWRAPGHNADLVLNSPYETELEILESMASGYVEAFRKNLVGLLRLEILLRVAWICFVAAPVAGLLTYSAVRW